MKNVHKLSLNFLLIYFHEIFMLTQIFFIECKLIIIFWMLLGRFQQNLFIRHRCEEPVAGLQFLRMQQFVKQYDLNHVVPVL
jgi:hypothetical protein